MTNLDMTSNQKRDNDNKDENNIVIQHYQNYFKKTFNERRCEEVFGFHSKTISSSN